MLTKCVVPRVVKSLPLCDKGQLFFLSFFFVRERKEGDNTILKIGNACSTVLTSITEKHEDLEVSEGVTKSLAKADKFKYDVFISYSHKNPKEAEMLLKIFGEVDDCVKVFYDRSALTTGNSIKAFSRRYIGDCDLSNICYIYYSFTYFHHLFARPVGSVVSVLNL